MSKESSLYTGIKMPGVSRRELRDVIQGKTFYAQVENIPGASFVPIDCGKFFEDYHKPETTFDLDVYTHVVYLEAVHHPAKQTDETNRNTTAG